MCIFAFMLFYALPYSSLCRQAVTNLQRDPMEFTINRVYATFILNGRRSDMDIAVVCRANKSILSILIYLHTTVSFFSLTINYSLFKFTQLPVIVKSIAIITASLFRWSYRRCMYTQVPIDLILGLNHCCSCW